MSPIKEITIPNFKYFVLKTTIAANAAIIESQVVRVYDVIIANNKIMTELINMNLTSLLFLYQPIAATTNGNESPNVQA